MFKFSTVEEVIEDFKNGKMAIVVDDEDRENEGDLVIPADKITGAALNFMITHAKGLVCAPIEAEIAEKLKFNPMVENNTDNHETAFTASVDYITTTTGISAFERAETISQIMNSSNPADFRRPGHVFPLIAKKKGVLERKGHTEASVDLAKLAGFRGGAVICEIIKEDGTMARRDDLFEFAEKFDLKIITIEEIIKYRLKHECVVEKQVSAKLPTKYGEFKVEAFLEKGTDKCHLALIKGDITDKENLLVRVHSECLTGDGLGSRKCDCGEQYEASMKMIEKEGRGVLLYMRQEGRGIGLLNKLKAYALQDTGFDTVEANRALGFDDDLRDYRAAADILKELGVNNIRLITNNPDKIEKLEKYDITIAERVSVEIPANKYDLKYLQTKKSKMRHLLNV